jgi:hypothetical protein
MSSSCCFLGTAPGETKEDEETSVSRWVRETRPTELSDRDAGVFARAGGGNRVRESTRGSERTAKGHTPEGSDFDHASRQFKASCSVQRTHHRVRIHLSPLFTVNQSPCGVSRLKTAKRRKWQNRTVSDSYLLHAACYYTIEFRLCHGPFRPPPLSPSL